MIKQKSRPDDTIGEKLARKLAGRTSSKSKALATAKSDRKEREKKMWKSGKMECNICSKTTPHKHY